VAAAKRKNSRQQARRQDSKGSLMILDTDKLNSDGEYRDEVRHRCLTDHFFLAELMGFTRFNKRVHQPVVDLYFPKNPKLSIEEQHPIKKRMHLDPRNTFKTTMGRVDSLQWILAFPEEISILNETATQPLGKSISAAIAVYLWKRPSRAPTALQLAFPELCVDKEPEGVWNTPVRKVGDVDTTLAFTSPKTSQSGWHPWVINPDDMVETTNSGIHASTETRQGVIDTYNTNVNLLRHGGYINMRGTRYHPFDLYGVTLDKMDPEEWKILIRKSIEVKNGQRMLPGEFPEEEDIILNFPELPNMDYRSLRQKYFEDYESFMCQQQNDPQGGNVQTFDEPLYKTMQIPAEKISPLGDTFICWRLPYAGKDYMAKYAEGIAGRVMDGKVYVLDAWQGTYTPSRLADKIVRECKRHQTGVVMMEDLPGINYIETHIRNEARSRNVSLRIQWLEFEEDDNQRFERMRNLEPQARAGRILISTGTGKSAELRSQLLNFGLVRENGILDCISRLASKIPFSLMRSDIDDEEKELQIRRSQEAMFNHIYGQQQGVDELKTRKEQEQAAHDSAMHKMDNMGLTDILGGLDG
jgi:hypothetical protein